MIFRNNIFKTFLFIAAFFCVAVYGDTYRVVTSANFPPYEYYARGSIVGIDIEIIREAFFRNGHDVIVEDMKFDSIIASIQTGKGAVAASGITVTEDRKKMVNFTIPYVSAKQVIIVPKNSPIKKAADLYNGKWRIGVQHGTTGDACVTEKIGKPHGFDDASMAVEALIKNKLDAVVIDVEPAMVYVAKNPQLILLPEPLTAEEYAFAVNKNNPELLAMLNKTLAEMHEDGSIAAIVKKYQIGNPDNGEIILETPEPSRHCLLEDFHTNFVKDKRWRYLLDGFLVTIIVAFCSVILGVSIGFFVAVIRSTADQTGKFKVLDFLCKIYLTVIRGTPVVLQLLIIYFVVFGSMDVNKILVAIIAFGINSGAYVAEIIRSGIMSIDRGQMEAGRSLGLSYSSTMCLVILPQALKNVLPALGNEFIVLLKETSVCGFIALQDLTRGGDIIRSQTYNAFIPLIAVALIYLILVIAFTKLLEVLERRLKKNE